MGISKYWRWRVAVLIKRAPQVQERRGAGRGVGRHAIEIMAFRKHGKSVVEAKAKHEIAFGMRQCQIRGSIVVSHAENPGSISGRGVSLCGVGMAMKCILKAHALMTSDQTEGRTGTLNQGLLHAKVHVIPHYMPPVFTHATHLNTPYKEPCSASPWQSLALLQMLNSTHSACF